MLCSNTGTRLPLLHRCAWWRQQWRCSVEHSWRIHIHTTFVNRTLPICQRAWQLDLWQRFWPLVQACSHPLSRLKGWSDNVFWGVPCFVGWSWPWWSVAAGFVAWRCTWQTSLWWWQFRCCTGRLSGRWPCWWLRALPWHSWQGIVGWWLPKCCNPKVLQSSSKSSGTVPCITSLYCGLVEEVSEAASRHQWWCWFVGWWSSWFGCKCRRLSCFLYGGN